MDDNHIYSLPSKGIIGLDIGRVRVGVAIVEPNTIFVKPLGTFKRGSYVAEKKILELIKLHEISTIIAGLPLDQQGNMTDQCADIKRFCSRLENRAELKIFYQDEYLSSVEANEYLASNNIFRGKSFNKELVDQISAVIILKRYLSNRNI